MGQFHAGQKNNTIFKNLTTICQYMKLSLISTLLFLFSFGAYSQTKAGNTHAFGITAGSTTGNGLAYRYHPSKWGVQIALLPNINEYRHNIYSGLAFLYRVTDNEKANFLFYNGHRFRFEPESTSYNLGFGVGLEIIMFKRLSFNLMAGYGAYRNFNDITFSGEISLLYRL